MGSNPLEESEEHRNAVLIVTADTWPMEPDGISQVLDGAANNVAWITYANDRTTKSRAVKIVAEVLVRAGASEELRGHMVLLQTR